MGAEKSTSRDSHKPDLVLRVGFAGNRQLPDESRVAKSLATVISLLEEELVLLHPNLHKSYQPPPSITQFYSSQPPRLRMVNGLAEGADRLASDVFLARRHPALQYDLAAILPFAIEEFRRSRDPAHYRDFDRLLGCCSFVLELNEDFSTADPDDPLHRMAAKRAYGAQASFLLRQIDLLLAIADPFQPPNLGGTRNTIQESMALGIPVIFIDARDGRWCLLDDPEGWEDQMLGDVQPSPGSSPDKVRAMIRVLLADPDVPLDLPSKEKTMGSSSPGIALVRDFTGPGIPPAKPWSIRNWFWKSFISLFPRKLLAPSCEPQVEPFWSLFKRAEAFNAHYSNHYRGAFIINYSLAMLAVLAAGLSLALLASPWPAPDHSSPGVHSSAESSHPDSHPSPTSGAHPAPGMASSHPTQKNLLLPVLFFLALFKFSVVVVIYFNTRQANGEGWNDRAIDYRYLAERLRGALFLTGTGSFRPINASRPQFSSRVHFQAPVDWLFAALLRGADPIEVFSRVMVRPYDNRPQTFRLDRHQVLFQTRAWVQSQAQYHAQNHHQLQAVHHRLEHLAGHLNLTVVFLVGLDILVLLAKGLHLGPEPVQEYLRFLTPWLVFVTGVIPAVVASLGGIRFQSECKRIADRSLTMSRLLTQLTERLDSLKAWLGESSSPHPPRCSSLALLQLTEECARTLIEEVTNWSVLYSKEVPEP